MKSPSLKLLIRLPLLLLCAAGFAQAQLALQKDDVIAIIGNGLGDRMQHDGWVETAIQKAHPDHNLRFRNMAYSGDTVDKRPRNKGFTPHEQYLKDVKADVIFVMFGYNESFAGVDKADKPLQMKKIDVTSSGRIIKGGLNRWTINTDYFKSWVHDRIDRDDELPGQWMLPQDATDDYCKQVVAEGRTVKPSGRVVWVQVRRDNHYLDCEMMVTACAHSVRAHVKGESGKPPPNVVKKGKQKSALKKPASIRPANGPHSNWFGR